MILFYAAQDNGVVKALETQMANHKVLRCRSFDTMVRRLRRPRHGLTVAVVVVSADRERAQLTGLRNLFRDLRLVVVLPDHSDTAVAWAHTMGPRFIAYADNGYDTVGAVLDRMVLMASSAKDTRMTDPDG